MEFRESWATSSAVGGKEWQTMWSGDCVIGIWMEILTSTSTSTSTKSFGNRRASAA